MTKAFSYVRISSDAQMKGDGYRRQIEKSRKFAERHGLELDESFHQQGRSESAFKGTNAVTGSLGRFLAAIDQGDILKGSYLLVESLDRLSRQETMKSLALFMRILESGLIVVTLIDEKEYRIDSATEGDIFMMIGAMSRAHDESRTKSMRSGANWSQKRKNIAERKLTAMCPRWLTLSHDKKTFAINEERAAVVRKIFADASSGIGMFTIARRLNSEQIPTFGESNGWHVSSVNKILCNRAVFGEFQPHKTIDGVRTPQGEPVKNYFPFIVDEETFYIAQRDRQLRRVSGAGRKGASISNLFTGLVHCNACGARMHFENKGAGPKGGAYFVCEAGYRKRDCESTRWRYDHFEASFLAFVEELDLGALLANKESASRHTMIEGSIKSLEGRLALLKQERERIFNWIRRPNFNSDFVRQQFELCETDIQNAEQALTEKRSALASLTQTFAKSYQDNDEIKRLVAQIRNREGDDIYKARAQIVSRLKTLVTHISVAVAGDFRVKKDLSASIEGFENLIGFDANDTMRYFAVGFLDGTYRIVYPSPDDPLKFVTQVSGGENIMNVSVSDVSNIQ